MAALMGKVKVEVLRWAFSPVCCQVRHARPGHIRRRPVKVLESEEKYNPHPDILERTDDDPFIRSPKTKQNNKHFKGTKQRSDTKISETLNRKIFMGIEYVTVPLNVSMQEKSRMFGDKLTAARSYKMRKSEKLLVLEGFTPIFGALTAGVEMDTLLFTKEEQLKALSKTFNSLSQYNNHSNANFYQLQSRQMEVYSDMTESHGLLGIFRIPKTGECPSMPKDLLPLTVVLDNIKDSMDMGMLIRSISAVGAQRLIVLKDCVDIWDKSAIRSAWGGHFRVPLYTDVEWHELQNYIQIDGNATFLTSSRSSILKKLQREIDSKTPEQLDELIDSLEIDDNLDEDEEDSDDDDDDDDNEKFSVAPIFSKLFYSVDYSQFSHVTLVITGEKYNIGAQCRKFLFRNNGQGVFLPMADNAKGVNSAVGGSVVLYEIQRQFAEKRKTDCE